MTTQSLSVLRNLYAGGAKIVILRESFRRRMTEESVTWEYGFFAYAALRLRMTDNKPLFDDDARLT